MSRNRISGLRARQARSDQMPTSSCVISSTTSQSNLAEPLRIVRRTQWSAVLAPMPRFCTEQCVLETSTTTLPAWRSADTICLAVCVLPVPGMPASRRLLPSRQCATGSGTSRQASRAAGRGASMWGSPNWPCSGASASSKRYTGVPSEWASCVTRCTSGQYFLGRFWKTTQSVLMAFK